MSGGLESFSHCALGPSHQHQAGNIAEDSVHRHQLSADVDRSGRDPQVRVVRDAAQWMANPAAPEAQLGHRAHERIRHRNNRRRLDGVLEPIAPGITPCGNERAEPKLGNGLYGKVELIVGEPSNQRFVLRAASPAERGAEYAGLDKQPQNESAARNESYSSSVRSSITRASSDSRIGAAANSASVRSRGSKLVPCGPSWSCDAGLLTAPAYLWVPNIRGLPA